MREGEFNSVMTAIRKRAAAAVGKTGLGLKPFAKKNGMGETVVRDLLKSLNKDVQLSTLAKIAKGADVPLVDLLPGAPASALSAAELEAAILDAFPLPEGSEETRARYLAELLEGLLQLPPSLSPNSAKPRQRSLDERAEDAPAHGSTK